MSEIYQFIESRKSSDTCKSNRCYEYCDVMICLIDIVGFSLWCSTNKPVVVTNAMYKYNELITMLLGKYQMLTKIELVGDSCLIVGGLYDNNDPSESVVEMVSFCVDLLECEVEKTIFNSYEVGGLRIGIHIGDVFGIFLRNPHRFQLFGNAINTASRLESTSYPNAIHISLKASEYLQEKNKRLDYGIVTEKTFKGVGSMFTKYITRVSDKILLAEDMKIHQRIIVNILGDKEIVVESDLNKAIHMMRNQRFKLVLLDLNQSDGCVLEQWVKFRQWESNNREIHQAAICVTMESDKVNGRTDLFDAVVSKDEIYKRLKRTCNKVLNPMQRTMCVIS